MDNAFIGQTEKPTPKQIAKALGPAAGLWQQLVTSLAEERGVNVQEWKSSSPKYGWSLLLKQKKRTILYLAPCLNCFRVSFALGDRAVAAARQTKLPASVTQVIEEAPRYGEGTGIRLLVKKPSDLPAILKLAEIKLAN
ncbi:MAG: DUF3788 domain-containing protein [Acidobacteriaceae bacterium]|nr:DUF3788 domain-containing protein [Acidobacteriaceae bacterium]